jgi:hypothetical protein
MIATAEKYCQGVIVLSGRHPAVNINFIIDSRVEGMLESSFIAETGLCHVSRHVERKRGEGGKWPTQPSPWRN